MQPIRNTPRLFRIQNLLAQASQHPNLTIRRAVRCRSLTALFALCDSSGIRRELPLCCWLLRPGWSAQTFQRHTANQSQEFAQSGGKLGDATISTINLVARPFRNRRLDASVPNSMSHKGSRVELEKFRKISEKLLTTRQYRRYIVGRGAG